MSLGRRDEQCLLFVPLVLMLQDMDY